jgi:hypothetical protein
MRCAGYALPPRQALWNASSEKQNGSKDHVSGAQAAA